MSKGWNGLVPPIGPESKINEIHFKAKYWDNFGHFGGGSAMTRSRFPFHYDQFRDYCVKNEESKMLASSFHRFAVTLNGILWHSK